MLLFLEVNLFLGTHLQGGEKEDLNSDDDVFKIQNTQQSNNLIFQNRVTLFFIILYKIMLLVKKFLGSDNSNSATVEGESRKRKVQIETVKDPSVVVPLKNLIQIISFTELDSEQERQICVDRRNGSTI